MLFSSGEAFTWWDYGQPGRASNRTVQKRQFSALDTIRGDDLQGQTEGSEETLEICLMKKREN